MYEVYSGKKNKYLGTRKTLRGALELGARGEGEFFHIFNNRDWCWVNISELDPSSIQDGFFSRAATIVMAANFYYTIPQPICQEKS